MGDNIIITEQEILENERIDAFFRGKMSDDDAQQFLKDLESAPQLKSKAVAMAHIIKAMDEVGSQQDAETLELIKSVSEKEFMDIVEEIQKTKVISLWPNRPVILSKSVAIAHRNNDKDETGIQEENKEQTKSISNDNIAKEVSKPAMQKIILLWRKHSVFLSVAASLLLLFMIGGGYQYIDYRNTQSLAEAYALSFDSPSYIKGEENADVTKELSDLYQNVKDGENIGETISRLTELWDLSKQDTYNNYTNYSIEIGYELAIAHLRNNDKEAAKQVLQMLCVDIDAESEIEKNVQKLLKEM